MVATTNKGLEKPARGSLSGVWDTPVNANMDIIDSSFGGVTNLALLGTNVTLSASQAQSAIISLTGALTADIAIIFPIIGGTWIIINNCTNSQLYAPFAYPGSGVGRYIGLMPGVTQIMSDGTNMRRVGLPPVGSYLQIALDTYPRWIFTSSVLPYINCDGSTFSAVTYPHLYYFLGGSTTLPDLRGRANYTSDQGINRITGYIGGLGQYGFAGGTQYLELHAHAVNITSGTNSLGHTHGFNYAASQNQGAAGGSNFLQSQFNTTGDTTGGESQAHTHDVVGATGTAGVGTSGNLPPLFVGGITMIRTGE